MNPLLYLAEKWRTDAELLRRYGDERGASVAELHADELEAAVAADRLDTLTLKQASKESGYSYSRLHQLVSEGRIPNAGRRNAPRIRRHDLPRKVGG